MKQTLLNTREDLTWLRETHLKATPSLVLHATCAVLYGNEDCPEHVELYAVDDTNARPFATFHADSETGDLSPSTIIRFWESPPA